MNDGTRIFRQVLAVLFCTLPASVALAPDSRNNRAQSSPIAMLARQARCINGDVKLRAGMRRELRCVACGWVHVEISEAQALTSGAPMAGYLDC